MTNQKDIFSYLVPGKCAHLAGIGGVSMSRWQRCCTAWASRSRAAT